MTTSRSTTANTLPLPLNRARSIPILRSRTPAASTTTKGPGPVPKGDSTAKSGTITTKPNGGGGLLRKPSIPLQGGTTHPIPLPATGQKAQAQAGVGVGVGVGSRASPQGINRKASSSRLGLEPPQPLVSRATATTTAMGRGRAPGPMPSVGLTRAKVTNGDVPGGEGGGMKKARVLPSRSMLDLRMVKAPAPTALSNPISTTTSRSTSRAAKEPSGGNAQAGNGEANRAALPTGGVYSYNSKLNPNANVLGSKRTIPSKPTISSSTTTSTVSNTTSIGSSLQRKASMPILFSRPPPAPAPAPVPAARVSRIDTVFGPATAFGSGAGVGQGVGGINMDKSREQGPLDLPLPAEHRPIRRMVSTGFKLSRVDTTPNASFSATPSPTKRPHQLSSLGNTDTHADTDTRHASQTRRALPEESVSLVPAPTGVDQTPLLARMMGRQGEIYHFDHLPMIADSSFSFEDSTSVTFSPSLRMGSNKDSLPPIGPNIQNQDQDQDQGQKAGDKEAREELKELQLLQKKEREREEEIFQLRDSLHSAQLALLHLQQEQEQDLLSRQGIERQKRDEEQRRKCREVEREVEAELERGREYREYLGVLKGLLGSKALCAT